MKPTKFKDQNIVFAENQPEYLPLPALRIEGNEGHVISCWKMTFKERIKVLFTGVIWLDLMSFNRPLTPSFMAVNRKEVYIKPEDKMQNFFDALILVRVKSKVEGIVKKCMQDASQN